MYGRALLVALLSSLCVVAARSDATQLPAFSSLTEPSPRADAEFGSAIAIGDIDGDTQPDIVVSATGQGSGGASSGGEFHVFFAAAGSAVVYSPSGAPRFAEALATGDINNDGYADVIAGSRYGNVGQHIGAGEAFVFFGPSLETWQRLVDPVPQQSAAFGISVAAGDVNGDAFDDVVVGAWDSHVGEFYKAGQAFVYFGPSLGSVMTLQSPSPQNVADFGVASGVGDVTGDGVGDVVIGSWLADDDTFGDAGRLFVFPGPSLSTVMELQDESGAGRRLGRTLAVGDVDGDPAHEILAGAESFATLFDVSPTGYSARRLPLPAAWTGAVSVAAADATGDGLADVLVGQPGAAAGTGAALLFVGPATAPPYELATAAVPGDALGTSVALAPGAAFAGMPGDTVLALDSAGSVQTFPIVDGDLDRKLDNDDNCPTDANAGQENADADFIDLSPPKAFDDLTWPASDAAGDACDADDDNDGLADAAESGVPCSSASAATDPTTRDSDGDLALDGAECALGTDPANAASAPSWTPVGDTDRDGLTDAFESALGTSTTNADSDGDGLTDGVEVRGYSSNALVVDADGDGCGDAREAASVNGDRTVNSVDLSQIAQSFGLMGGAVYLSAMDVNRDARVSAIDLSIAARNFGPC